MGERCRRQALEAPVRNLRLALPLVLAGLGLASPSLAQAEDATIVSREVPLAGQHVSAPSPRRSRPRGSTSSGCTGAARDPCSSGRARSVAAGAPGTTPRPRTTGPTAAAAERARKALVASGQPLVGGNVRPDRVPAARSGHASARALRLEPDVERAVAHAPEGRLAGDRAARRLEGRRADQARRAELRAGDPVLRRPPHGGDERLHGGPIRRHGARRSRSTTCAGTAGTTSATTSSSTSTARSSRAASAESRATSSARTRRASTPARSASPCSASTARSPSPARRRMRSLACSPGASTSPTSTRAARSRSRPGATRAFPRAWPSSCAQSRDTATRGSRTARALRSTTC